MVGIIGYVVLLQDCQNITFLVDYLPTIFVYMEVFYRLAHSSFHPMRISVL